MANRSVVIDMTEAARPRHIPTGETEEICVVGETPRTKAGYFVRVSAVRFKNTQGSRIRLRVFKGEEFQRHLDITTEVARDLVPILHDAAALGAVR